VDECKTLIPGGIVTSDQIRHLAGVVKSCGEDGCADITTRQNLQLRGIELKDTPEIIQGVMDMGMCTLQSGQGLRLVHFSAQSVPF